MPLSSIDIFPPNSEPYSLPYEDHIKNFWKWVISLPKDNSPWHDDTGERCSRAQSTTNSPVFYLGGNGGGRSKRTCRVPPGKGILIPVLVVEVSEKDFPKSPKSVQELRRIAKKDQDSVKDLYLKIDNREYNMQELAKYRKATGDFSVTFPENPIFKATKGEAKAVADGHYIITRPPPKGKHTVHYRSSLSCDGTDCLEQNFGQDIECDIIAE